MIRGYCPLAHEALTHEPPDHGWSGGRLRDYSFDDINTMSFTTLLSAQIAEW